MYVCMYVCVFAHACFSGNWLRAFATASLRVLPPRQTQLQWDRPAGFRYPQPLALDRQLTARVADRTTGQVSYRPPPGTVLPPG